MKLPFKPKKKQIDYSRPVDIEKRTKKLQQMVRTRFIVLITVLALLLGALVLRLYEIQVVDYQENLKLASELSIQTNSSLNPRGDIVDRNGKVLVTNQEFLSIIYSAPLNETTADIWDKAIRFTELFDVSYDHFIYRDLQDAYITFFPEEAKQLITEEENLAYLSNEMTDSQYYQLQVNRIDDDMISQLNEEQLKQFAIYQRMAILPGLVKVIKEEVSANEVALLLDHIDEFGGFNVTTGWKRQQTPGNNLGALLGSLYTSKQGLPKEEATSYLANDYNVNDQVGRSGLELEYEQVLSGEKSIYSIEYDELGYANRYLINEGSIGATLHTTIDLDFQNYLEQEAINVLEAHESDYNARYMKKMYVVVSDPNTGDILANVAIRPDSEGNYYQSATSTYTDAYPMGSAIKGVMVYMALDQELMQPGEIIIDAPIKIAATPSKSSYRNLGPVNDLTALSVSSNIYMYNVVIRLGNGNYQYNQPLYLESGVEDTMRFYFSQFGLGTNTGIDVPFEGTGYKASSQNPGVLLDFGTGQYDSYTPLQLNQYISTIANGEYRHELRFVSHATDPYSGEIVYENNDTIVNSISNEMAIDRVQQGFRLCVTSGYCTSLLDSKIQAAAKTGTAEDFARDPITDELLRDSNGELIEVSNSTMVAYAPYDDPEIAVSCVAPFNFSERVGVNACSQITKNALNYFAENYKNTP